MKVKNIIIIIALVASGYVGRVATSELATYWLTYNITSCISSAIPSFDISLLIVRYCESEASKNEIIKALLWTPQLNIQLIKDFEKQHLGVQ